MESYRHLDTKLSNFSIVNIAIELSENNIALRINDDGIYVESNDYDKALQILKKMEEKIS